MFDFAKQAQEARRLLQVGRKGLATVVAVRDTGVMVDENPQAELDLQVAVAGVEPYTVTHRQVIPPTKIPSVQVGAPVPLRVDPMDVNRVLIVGI